MSQKDIHTIIDEVIREVVNPNWQISSIPDGYEHGILDEDENNNILYHGTSIPSWNKKYNGKSTLYLSNNKIDASNYAYEMAANDETNGMTPEPILCMIESTTLFKQPNIEFNPDWGGVDLPDNMSWEESLDKYGGFSIHSDIDKIKQLFIVERL